MKRGVASSTKSKTVGRVQVPDIVETLPTINSLLFVYFSQFLTKFFSFIVSLMNFFFSNISFFFSSRIFFSIPNPFTFWNSKQGSIIPLQIHFTVTPTQSTWLSEIRDYEWSIQGTSIEISIFLFFLSFGTLLLSVSLCVRVLCLFWWYTCLFYYGINLFMFSFFFFLRLFFLLLLLFFLFVNS